MRAEPTVDDLRRLRVDEGLTVAQIAQRVGLPTTQVKHRLYAAGIYGVRRPARRAGFAELGERAGMAFQAEVALLYKDGETIRGIAARVGSDQRTVWRELEAAGVRRRPPGRVPQVISAPELRRLYVKEDRGVAEIARRLGVSASLVQRSLDRHGIPRKARGPIPKRHLTDLYVKQGLSIKGIGRLLGRSGRRVREDLDRYGIAVRPPGRQPTRG